jgi:eukaryotic-like serine/threonine-protein kinase
VPLRILIIDDPCEFRSWLSHHLAAAQPQAEIIAHDPAAGGRLPPAFELPSWDLLFIDHQLGEHDGLELLRELKAQPGCPPIVCLAPQGDEHVIVRALQEGADDFLSKGHCSHEHIRRLVREALQRGRRTGARPTAARESAEPAFQLKGHVFLKALGSGSTASVCLMERLGDGRLVVVKVFRHVPDRIEQVAPLQRFLREHEVVSGIRHANVVQIFDLGIADDMAFIVMEYFAGGHLGERMNKTMSARQALEYLAQIARALEAVHGVGVLHRDLKPANIMVRDDGTLALIDFGVAKLREEGAELTSLGEIFGTPYYMSPEQGAGGEVDERADIYSLGAVFYEMLTGHKPYVAASPMGVIWKQRHAPLPVLPAPYTACQALLNRMMAKAPAERLPSAAALLEAIAGLQDHITARASRPTGRNRGEDR